MTTATTTFKILRWRSPPLTLGRATAALRLSRPRSRSHLKAIPPTTRLSLQRTSAREPPVKMRYNFLALRWLPQYHRMFIRWDRIQASRMTQSMSAQHWTTYWQATCMLPRTFLSCDRFPTGATSSLIVAQAHSRNRHGPASTDVIMFVGVSGAQGGIHVQIGYAWAVYARLRQAIVGRTRGSRTGCAEGD